MDVEVDVRRIVLQPGDKLLIEHPLRLGREAFTTMRSKVADWAQVSIDSVLVIEDGARLRILSKEETADVSTSNP